jgi:hypothetical protein
VPFVCRASGALGLPSHRVSQSYSGAAVWSLGQRAAAQTYLAIEYSDLAALADGNSSLGDYT